MKMTNRKSVAALKRDEWSAVVRAQSFTLSTLLTLLTFHLQLSTFAQGNLTPPGPPAPGMKTLAQVEPRTPISSLPFIITSSGSYYLTTNLTGVSGTNGITITVDNVTLDLSGFALTGVAGSSNGVFGPTGLKNLALRNGVLRNWGRAGASLANVSNSRLLDLRFSNNGSGGAVVGANGVIQGCVAYANTTFGLFAGAGSVVKDSTAGATTGDGITTVFNGTVIDSSACDNSNNGIVTGSSSNIRGCTANGNSASGISTAGSCHIEGCSASANSTQGIWPNDYTKISRCTAANNTGDGISINSFSSVTDCVSNNNLGNGIYTSGDFNRIEGNYVSHNADRGIRLHSANTSVVIRNTAAANTNGDLPTAGTNIGPVQNPSTATNPAANFEM